MLKIIRTKFIQTEQIDSFWLLVFLLVYLSFLFLDVFSPELDGASILKYVGIFLCLIYAYRKFKSDHILILAILFTLLADTVLIWTPYYIAGVIFFCFAQFFHMSRLSAARPKFLIFYVISSLLIFAFAILRDISPIYAIAAIYAGSLLTNLLLSIRWRQKNPQDFRANCAMFGFILFVCCDFCVAMQFLDSQSILTVPILPIVSFLVWFFYFPSQVLISSSSTIPD